MGLPQSPPTTSGIVVLSGSNFFDPQTSDFPIVAGTIQSSGRRGASPIIGTPPVFDDFFDLVVPGGRIQSSGRKGAISVVGAVLTLTSDVEIRSTPVTTSGVVVMDMFIGAGEIFVVPAVGNVRLFPIFQGAFPEQDRRVFPRLPQSSTLTPGD